MFFDWWPAFPWKENNSMQNGDMLWQFSLQKCSFLSFWPILRNQMKLLFENRKNILCKLACSMTWHWWLIWNPGLLGQAGTLVHICPFREESRPQGKEKDGYSQSRRRPYLIQIPGTGIWSHVVHAGYMRLEHCNHSQWQSWTISVELEWIEDSIEQELNVD